VCSHRFGSSVAALSERRNIAAPETSAVADRRYSFGKLIVLRGYVDGGLETNAVIAWKIL
jgi:hypothetical protein